MTVFHRGRALAIVVGLLGLALFVEATPYARGWLIGREVAGPFVLELGRGSGWHGLDTAKVLDDGTVALHRLKRGDAQVARLKLSTMAMTRLDRAIAAHRLFELNFPTQITEFADEFDDILEASGLADAVWRDVAYLHSRGHDKDLWDSIR
jgi:hypothetical protein